MTNQEDSQRLFKGLYSEASQAQLLDSSTSEDFSDPPRSFLCVPSFSLQEGLSKPQRNHLTYPYCQLPYSSNLSRISTINSNPNSFSNFNPYSSSFLPCQSAENVFTESYCQLPLESNPYPYQIQSSQNLEMNSYQNTFFYPSGPAADIILQQETPIANKKLSSVDREWSSQDDQILLDYVERYRNDWKKVFREFKKRNKNVTIAYLKNKYRFIKTTPFELRVRFTHQEDLLIAKYVNMLGKKWDEIAGYFHNRTPIMIKNRYYSFIKKRNIMKELLSESLGKDPIFDPTTTSNTDPSSERSPSSNLDSVQHPSEGLVDQYLPNIDLDCVLDERNDPFEDPVPYSSDQVDCTPTTESKVQTEVLEPELANFQENLKIHEQLHNSFFFRDLFPELFTEAELQERDDFMPFEIPSKDKKP